jgi:hypothetical protein
MERTQGLEHTQGSRSRALESYCHPAVQVVAEFWARLASFASRGLPSLDRGSVQAVNLSLRCVSDRVMPYGSPNIASLPASRGTVDELGGCESSPPLELN